MSSPTPSVPETPVLIDGAPMAEAAARPSRGDLRRQAIVDIARETFLSVGYAAASMSAIGAKAGGSKATLYTYFPSKADLFSAVVQEMAERTRMELFALNEQRHEIVEFLTRLGRRYLRIILAEQMIVIHRLVVAEAVRFPELGQMLYEVGPRYGNACVADVFRAYEGRGDLVVPDSLKAAGHFFELCTAGLYRRRLWNVAQVPTEDEMDQNVDDAVRVFLAAYGAKAAPTPESPP